jgi:predicted acetyltransferase
VSGSDVEVIPADYSDKGVLRRLVELYCYDFSEFDGQDLDAHGTYGYRYLDHFWTDDDRFPFLFRVAEAWAGFALVRAGPPHSIAEFFVLRKYRRAGVGSRAARELFTRFPGEWEVHELHANVDATPFWRAAIPYEFSETSDKTGVIQRFRVPG